ncbi:hypothetical protein EV363DRAFT_1100721, partial [Boletus edulis]
MHKRWSRTMCTVDLQSGSNSCMTGSCYHHKRCGWSLVYSAHLPKRVAHEVCLKKTNGCRSESAEYAGLTWSQWMPTQTAQDRVRREKEARGSRSRPFSRWGCFRSEC